MMAEFHRGTTLDALENELIRLRDLQLKMAFEFSGMSRELQFQRERVLSVGTMIKQVEELIAVARSGAQFEQLRSEKVG